MRTKVFLLLLLFTGYCAIQLSAQKKNQKITLTGTVVDVSENPITGAIVMIDGKNTESVTDPEGKYKIRVKPDVSTIGIFTFGNGIIEDSIMGRTQIDFNFSNILYEEQSNKIAAGDEAVNLGYALVKRKNLTNSVGTFNSKDSKRIYGSVRDMLMEIPGGFGGASFSGSGGPLIVVNGIAVPTLDGILPSTVESIVFLKDASAAMYGSRAFGGVILIKTKIPLDEK